MHRPWRDSLVPFVESACFERFMGLLQFLTACRFLRPLYRGRKRRDKSLPKQTDRPHQKVHGNMRRRRIPQVHLTAPESNPRSMELQTQPSFPSSCCWCRSLRCHPRGGPSLRRRRPRFGPFVCGILRSPLPPPPPDEIRQSAYRACVPHSTADLIWAMHICSHPPSPLAPPPSHAIAH